MTSRLVAGLVGGAVGLAAGLGAAAVTLSARGALPHPAFPFPEAHASDAPVNASTGNLAVWWLGLPTAAGAVAGVLVSRST